MLKEKEVKPEILHSFLSQQMKYHQVKLEKAETVDDILHGLEKKFSFWDHKIFQCLIKEYNLDESCPDLQFPTQFQSYVQKQTVADFIRINSSPITSNTESGKMKKLTLTFDISAADHNLEKVVCEVQEEVAKCLKVSTLKFHSIAEGSVIVTFLVSAHEPLPNDYENILKQSKLLQDLSLKSVSLTDFDKTNAELDSGK